MNVRSKNVRKVKKVKKLTQTALLRKYEPIMRDLIIERDGGVCALKQFPNLQHKCRGPLVADHRPASRKHHSTFLDPRNLTCVCNGANASAGPFKNFIIMDAIADVVKNREGFDTYKEIISLSRTTKKWDEPTITNWLENCKRYFIKNKNGAPK